MGTAIKHPVPYRVKSSFVICDIRALWLSGLSVRVPGCQTLQVTAGTGCLYSCTHMATVGVKELRTFKRITTLSWYWSHILRRVTWSHQHLRSSQQYSVDNIFLSSTLIAVSVVDFNKAIGLFITQNASACSFHFSED